MQLTQQPSGMPLQIVHPGNAALPLTTRIRCEETGEGSPRVFVSCLLLGEWSEERDWWKAHSEEAPADSALAKLFPTQGARTELETRGWELLSHLGYVPQGWESAA